MYLWMFKVATIYFRSYLSSVSVIHLRRPPRGGGGGGVSEDFKMPSVEVMGRNSNIYRDNIIQLCF